MRRALDPALGALVRALRAWDGGALVVEESASRAWASATFEGSRHRLRLRFAGADARDRASVLADGAAEIDFRLPRHLVADLAVVAQPDAETLVLDALLLDAA